MRRNLLATALALLPAAGALADHGGHNGDIGWGEVATSAGISASLYSTFKDEKLVLAAEDDASSFVASGGSIRGAYLEAALQQIRRDHPDLKASDEELASAILAGAADSAAR